MRPGLQRRNGGEDRDDGRRQRESQGPARASFTLDFPTLLLELSLSLFEALFQILRLQSLLGHAPHQRRRAPGGQVGSKIPRISKAILASWVERAPGPAFAPAAPIRGYAAETLIR